MIKHYSNVPLLYADKSKLNFIPGIENYLKLARYTYPQGGLTDRTGLSMPFHTECDLVPTLNLNFNLSFEDCMLDQINRLDSIHNKTGKKFRLMYSGGIDTVTIFSAFVDYYGMDACRKILEISCSRESIYECPELWNDYIRKYNFSLHHSHDHSIQWMNDKIFITGDNCDSLFSNMYYPEYCGDDDLYKKPDVLNIANFLTKHNITEDSIYAAEKFLEMAERSQVPITNNYLFYWYIDFVTIWAGTSWGLVLQSPETFLPADFFSESFHPFFMSTNFQQWSMNFHLNFPDRYGELKNYKQICKDYIYQKLRLENYRYKYKIPSLPAIHTFRRSAYFIDSNCRLYRQINDFSEHTKLTNDLV